MWPFALAAEGPLNMDGQLPLALIDSPMQGLKCVEEYLCMRQHLPIVCFFCFSPLLRGEQQTVCLFTHSLTCAEAAHRDEQKAKDEALATAEDAAQQCFGCDLASALLKWGKVLEDDHEEEASLCYGKGAFVLDGHKNSPADYKGMNLDGLLHVINVDPCVREFIAKNKFVELYKLYSGDGLHHSTKQSSVDRKECDPSLHPRSPKSTLLVSITCRYTQRRLFLSWSTSCDCRTTGRNTQFLFWCAWRMPFANSLWCTLSSTGMFHTTTYNCWFVRLTKLRKIF